MPILGWSNAPGIVSVPAPRAGRLAQCGFTLLEMLVVMALLSLLAAIVLPSFSRWFDQSVRRSEAADALSQVRALRDRSLLMGLDFELRADTANTLLPDGRAAVALPQGWGWLVGGGVSSGVTATNSIAYSEGKTLASGRLVFHRNGACEPGRLGLQDGQKQRWTLGMAAPRCDLTLVLQR